MFYYDTANGECEIFIQMLIRKIIAELKYSKDSGNALLHSDAEKANHGIVTVLINHDADAKDEDWQIPLHFAVAAGNRDVIKLLISKKSKIDAQDRCGDTLLPFAVRGNDKAMVKLLIKDGVSVNFQNRKGENSLHIAIREESENGANMHEDIAKMREDTAKVLIAHKDIDVNTQDSEKTPLD